MATKRMSAEQATYARCKGFGHRWSDLSPSQILLYGVREETIRGWGVIAFQCDTCQVIKFCKGDPRTDTWLAARYINHTEEYQQVHLDNRSQWKSVYFRRVYQPQFKRNGSE